MSGCEPKPRVEWSASTDRWYVVHYALGVQGPFDTEAEAEAVAEEDR